MVAPYMPLSGRPFKEGGEMRCYMQQNHFAGLHRLCVHERRPPAEHRAPLRPVPGRAGAALRLPGGGGGPRHRGGKGPRPLKAQLRILGVTQPNTYAIGERLRPRPDAGARLMPM